MAAEEGEKARVSDWGERIVVGCGFYRRGKVGEEPWRQEARATAWMQGAREPHVLVETRKMSKR